MGGETLDADLLDLLGPAPEPRPPRLAPRKMDPNDFRANRSPKSPEFLQRLVDLAATTPSAASICKKVGISYATLKRWLGESVEDAPGFDLPLGPTDDAGTVRFHEAFEHARLSQIEQIEHTIFQQAVGYLEPLTYKGRVIYRYDAIKQQEAIEAGQDPMSQACYLLDAKGEPIPETVRKVNGELAMFILKSHKPQVYGNKTQMDVNVRGGVLVVSPKITNPQDLNVIEAEYRREGAPPVRFIEGD